MIFPGGISFDQPVRQIRDMRELDYPYEARYFDAGNGVRIAYGDIGTGLPIICIHGLGSYGPAWIRNANMLQEEFRLLIPDLPGYGKSDKSGFTVSIEEFARILVSLADHLGIDRFLLAGHSMGGQIAMHMAHNRPDRVAGLALTAPAALEEFTDAENRWMQQFYGADIIRYTLPMQVYMNYTQNFYDLPRDALFMVRHRIEMSYADDFPEYCRIIPACLKAMQEDRPAAYIPKIKQPAFAIYGKEDRLIPNRFLHPSLRIEEVIARGKRLLPQLETELYSKTGHFPHWERASRFNDLIRKLAKEM